MPAYGNMDIAIPGLIAEGIQPRLKRSRAAQQDIQYGAVVMSYLGDENTCYNYATDTSKIVWDADFVTGNLIDITVNGVAITQVPFNTDHDTTMDDIVTQVTAGSITDSVLGVVVFDAALDAGDANNRTLYIRTKGLDSTVTEAVTAGASQATGTITTQSDQVFLGGATFIQKSVEESTPTTQASKWFKDQSVCIMEKGIMWMYAVAPVTAEGKVYIDNSGAGKGTVSDTGDLTNALFRSNIYTNTTTSDVIAKTELRGTYKLNSIIAWV